jgi:hypothetical protein
MDHHLFGIGWQLLMALSSGLLIGIERQSNRVAGQKHLGIRDFTLIALLAFIASYLQGYNQYIWPIAFSGVMLLGVVVFVFESLGALHQDGPVSRAGITTILSFPIVFLIASLSVFHVEFWLMATVVFIMLILLELKDQWHQFASTIEKHELLDFSILIAIALVITPLIPADAAIKVPLYSFAQHALTFQAVNVATFWKVLLMVSFMSFIAHFITKYIRGRNALLLATFFGGLVSSLATIILFLRGSNGRGRHRRRADPHHPFEASREREALPEHAPQVDLGAGEAQLDELAVDETPLPSAEALPQPGEKQHPDRSGHR